MTVIAACVKDGKAAMASDALGSMGDLALPGRRKLFPCGDAMLGYAGASIFGRPLSLLPQCDAGREEDFCLSVVSAIRQFASEHELDREEYACSILVASAAGIWLITSFSDIEKIDGDFWAVGSGQEIAIGAMYVTDLGGATVDTMVEMGVTAACALTISCGGDVTIMEL